MTPDSGQDALSLTLPKVGSRTRGKRRKIPKPPKWVLFLVFVNAFSSVLNALEGHWVRFAYCVFLLVYFWSEMLFAMKLRRPPWWRRGPAEGVTLAALLIAGAVMTFLVEG